MDEELRPVGSLVDEEVTEANGQRVRRHCRIIGHVPGENGKLVEAMIVLIREILPRDRPGPTVLK